LITEWASKYPGAVARIAAILHVASGDAQVISREVAENAVKVGEFFAGHAMAAFSQTQHSSTTATLRYLLRRINEQELLDFTAAELSRLCRGEETKNKAKITPYLEELENLGWVRKEDPPPRPANTRSRLPDATWKAWPGLWSEGVKIG
jgi:replicative DNA helicase